MAQCSVDGCSDDVVARELCGTHYQRWYRHGTVEETRGYGATAKQNHPLYRRWAGIKQRCKNPKNRSYKNYGARGVAICERWDNDFWAFVEDVGLPPSTKHSLDRIDFNGNYEPGNVRWATAHQQCQNRRTSLLNEEQVGVGRELRKLGMSFADITRKLDVDYEAIRNAINGKTFNDQNDYSQHPIVLKELEHIKPKQQCSMEGCDRQVFGYGFCRQHYRWHTESKTYADMKERKCKHCGDQLPANFRIDRMFCSISCKMKYHRQHGCYSEEQQKDNPRCSVEGCDRPRHAQGMCRKHYMQKWHAENPRQRAAA